MAKIGNYSDDDIDDGDDFFVKTSILSQSYSLVSLPYGVVHKYGIFPSFIIYVLYL